ncbi:MAG: ribosomal protein S18-alanine N-acetyltransferase [Nitrospirae bacterium]|nr:ribosomal protein S18-alanine N-acetyltransferase [Candidatus Manganitrophaceae bacterium]
MDSLLTQLHFSTGEISDLDEMMVIEHASFSRPWTEGMMLAELFNNPVAFSMVVRAGEDEKIVAQVFMRLMLDELHLLNLGVHPRWRRHGLGTQLIQHVLKTAIEKGTERVILEVRASNEAAQGLYQKMGFRQIGLRKNYYCKPTENALLLGCTLEDIQAFSETETKQEIENQGKIKINACNIINTP